MARNTNWNKPIKLGSGAYGAVYSNEKTTAVKISPCGHVKGGWDNVQSTLREIHAYNQLPQCESFVTLKRISYVKGQMHLYMNRADGNLKIVSTKDLSAATIEKFTVQLLKGLFAMRNHRMFHRDIKPENILVNLKTSTLSFCDFGLSRHLQDDSEYGTGYIVTRWYIAPELLEFQKKDKRSSELQFTEKMDIYSIGAILYELIFDTWLAPGKNIEETLDQMKRRVGRLTVEKLKDHPKVTEKVAKVLVGCLAIDPKERFNCARALFKMGELTADEVMEFQEDSGKFSTLKYAPIQPRRDLYNPDEWDQRAKWFNDLYQKFPKQRQIIAYALVVFDRFCFHPIMKSQSLLRFAWSVMYSALVIGTFYKVQKLIQHVQGMYDPWSHSKSDSVILNGICKWTEKFYTGMQFIDISEWESGKEKSFNVFMKSALKNPYDLKRKR